MHSSAVRSIANRPSCSSLLLAAMMTCSGLSQAGLLDSAPPLMSVGMRFEGVVTMLTGNGQPIRNGANTGEPRFKGWRTPVTGSMVLNIGLNGSVVSGIASFDPFRFVLGFLDAEASGRDITFVPPHTTILGIPTDTLLLGNMLFDYGAFETGIPVSLVLDVGTISTSLLSAVPGSLITGIPGLMTAASEDTTFPAAGGTRITRPIGPVLVSTTRFDTTDVDTDSDGNPGPLDFEVNPSGTTPLLTDTTPNAFNVSGTPGVGGSPIQVGAFFGINPNFDFTQVTVTCVNLIGACQLGDPGFLGSDLIPPPIPLSAQPLSGLLGLLGR